METSNAKWLRILEDENGKLKKTAGSTDVGQRDAARHQFKKVVTPVGNEKAVVHSMEVHQVS